MNYLASGNKRLPKREQRIPISQQDSSLSSNVSALEQAVKSLHVQEKEFDPVWSILTIQDLNQQYSLCCEQLADINSYDPYVQYPLPSTPHGVYEESEETPRFPSELTLPSSDVLTLRPRIQTCQRLRMVAEILQHYERIDYAIVQPTPEDLEAVERKTLHAEHQTGIPRPYASFYDERECKHSLWDKILWLREKQTLTPEEQRTPRGYWKMRVKTW